MLKNGIISNGTDAQGDPSGGYATATGIRIEWQDGPVPEGGVPSGAFVEDVIEIAIARIEHYQLSRFNCKANADALDSLRAARASLHSRTAERVARGVEGKHEV
jgi:hypothetical protein